MLKRHHMLLADTVVLGVIGALCAQAFMALLRWSEAFFLGWLAGYRLPDVTHAGGIGTLAAAAHGPWLIPLSTTLGGLAAGVLVYGLAPEAEGHGTDTVVNSFHNLRGVLRARVPFVKMVASALTIGSGGSAGREGPTALVSAGFASIYARWRGYSEKGRRRLLLAGMAAGLSAIFRSPIGTAIFAVEVLYSEMEFEAGSLVYTMIGSVVAYAVNGTFVGFRPLFEVPAGLPEPTPLGYAWYIVLGVVCGAVASLMPTALYGVRDLFRKLPCPPHLKPAIGGLGVGLIAVAFPHLLGGGYTWIQSAIDGGIAMKLLVILTFGKILTFALTIGSGGSGGVFAPSLFTGAMLGGALGQVFHQPGAAFVVVGMAAVFGAAARVPIATLLMVTEMTGGYQLLVGAALAVTLATLVETLVTSRMKYRSLYEAQVPTRPYSPAHYTEQVRVALDLLRTHAVSPLPTERGLEVISLLASGVPVSVAGDRRIRIGVLQPKSPCVGHSIEDGCLTGPDRDVELILVLRGNRTFLPHAGLRLEIGDQIVAVARDAEWARLAQHLYPVEPGRRSLWEPGL